MSPKISIIVPSYNQGKYIEQTLFSVINQTYKNFELIVIDGGSTDETLDIIKKYDNEITYWISEKDSGQSAAINKGFKLATGQIIAWLNSDDLYCNNTLEEISKLFTQNLDVDIVYGDVINFSENGKEFYVHNQFELYDFFSRVSIHQPSVFWKRNILNETGCLDESLHYCMDYDLWMRLFLDFKSLKIEETLSRFRIHNTSKTNNNPIELYDEYQTILCRFFNSLPSSEWKEKLISSGIYFNTNDLKYSLKRNFSRGESKKIFNIYLNNAINLEYVKKNRKLVNSIIFKNPHIIFNFKNILTAVKNCFKFRNKI